MQSPSIQTMLGAAGACPEIRFRGQLWKIGHPTQKAKAALEELAASKAVAEVRALALILPPADYTAVFRELTASLAAGDYGTWGSGWQRVVMGPHSGSLFLLALLREHQPGATEQDAKALSEGEPEQVGAALARVVPGFFGMLLDEKGLAPAERAQADQMIAGVIARFLGSPGTSPPPSPSTPTSDG